MNASDVIAWIRLGQQVFAEGSKVWAQIKPVLKDSGIEVDNAQLDSLALDTDQRIARIKAELNATGEGP